jgi:peptidoglycan/xylan/chitin deacetylase (PgdA/CDA1 family)
MTFFINSSSTWVTGFTSTLTQAVRDGHEIGNHTVHHCHADTDGTLYNGSGNQRTACPGASAAAELDECTAFITSTLGAKQVFTAASPFGDTGYMPSARERFFLNRGVMDGSIGANDGTDPFDLPMWGPAENDTAAAFNAKIDSAHRRGRWLIVLLHSIAPTSARWYATVDIAAITGSIEHARSLGDVWIDTMASVGAYWRGQKVFSSATSTASGDTRTWSWNLPAHFPPGKHLRVKVDGGTLSQRGRVLDWDGHGYYEIALDAGSLTLAP